MKINKLLSIKEGLDILRVIMGAIFVMAAIYRTINVNAGIMELRNFNILPIFLVPLILLELTLGVLLIIGRMATVTVAAASIFLCFAILVAIITKGREILSKSSELFVFRATPTDLFLHLIYLAVLIFLFQKYR
jgi:uncharacterized membrane protein YphA (DoxX/SURF4 family)